MEAKEKKKIERYTEKVFTRLTNSFLDFLKTVTNENQIDPKLTELNDMWLKHCDTIKAFISPEAKDEFLRVAGLMMADIRQLHKMEKK